MSNPTGNQSSKADPQGLPVLIHLERWTERDEIERVETVEADVSDVVAELSPEDRKALSDAALAGDSSLDWIYERLIELGLLAPHDGPFTVDLEPLAELLKQNSAALDSVPLRPKRVVTPGVPLVRLVSVDQALADADEDGFLTALLQVPFDDLLAAHASRDDQYDEHDLLAAKVSPLLPYASEYRVVGLVHDEDGVSQPDLLVLFTNNVAEAASTLLDNEEPRD